MSARILMPWGLKYFDVNPVQVFTVEFDVGRSEKFPVICFSRKAASKSIPHLCSLCCRNDAEGFAQGLSSSLQVPFQRRILCK